MNHLKIVVFLVVLAMLPFVALACWLCKPLTPHVAAFLEPWYDDILGRFALMAVVNTKSGMITDMDATPVVEAAAYRHHGRVRSMNESFSIANGDSATSTIRVLRVWSGWRIEEVLISSPDIGTTTAADIGLYKVAADGGAVVDADFFASALSLSGGAHVKVDITREQAVITPANADTRIWEQLGLTADPQIWYDVTLTLTGAADAAGVGDLTVRYVDGT